MSGDEAGPGPSREDVRSVAARDREAGHAAEPAGHAAERAAGILSPSETLVARSHALAALVDAAAAVGFGTPDARERAGRLRDHLRTFVLPRAESLDAPLVVLLFGPTGSGKSSLANAIAGRAVSPTGVLRPTTREAILLAAAADRDALVRGPLAGVAPDVLTWRPIEAGNGVAVVDSPDIDSVETANRELAERLIEAADSAVFVTTATRYADRVPWTVLRRVAERRLPLLVVVNRLPRDAASATEVLDDVGRLVARSALVGADEGSRLTLVPIAEGELDPERDALSATAAGPVLERIARLRADAGSRRALAARSLAGALAGLTPALETTADDLEREAIDAEALRRAVDGSYRAERTALRDELRGGAFLRGEILRRWQDYVGADRLTRSLSRGMARVETSLRSALRRGPDARVAAVRKEASGELVELADAHLAEAVRRAATAWQETPAGSRVLAADGELWSTSSGLRAELARGVDDWLASIATAIAATGAPKRRLARGAATGVNAAGVGVMLAVFLHTGGLTGAEMGVAAGTALVNQRLLEAIFGEAAIARLVEGAAQRLDALLDGTFASEAARFTGRVPDGGRLRELASSLREEARFAAIDAAAALGDTSGVEGDAPRHPSVDVERGDSEAPAARRGIVERLGALLFGSRRGG